MNSYEVNFDGLVGLTHNYAGLSFGNVASSLNSGLVANPKAAALQGLQKMKALADKGLKQALLPPHERPAVPMLRGLGFTGSDVEVLAKAWAQAPQLATASFSASAMWTANAATVSPWPDTADGRTHFTPANLTTMFHRAYEAKFTHRVLTTIFADSQQFAHHPPLPSGPYFGDEGAANHTRFCASHNTAGVEFFVYGASAFAGQAPKPQHFPARQSLEACQAIARLHQLDQQRCVFAQQNPQAIDEGVFHNDVIAVGHQNVLFYHEQAFLDQAAVVDEITQKMAGTRMHFIQVPTAEVSIATAVKTYLFNIQLINIAADATEDHFMIIAPSDCKDDPAVHNYLNNLLASAGPVKAVHYFDLRQSMRNGGGPACLRLRVVMNDAQIAGLQARVFIDDDLYQELVAWVNRHYRDQLSVKDLRDPQLLQESHTALDELSRILRLGTIYDFQR